MSRNKPRMMALHCGGKGIGYAVFEGATIYDWGTIVAHGDKNAMSLRKLSPLIDRFSPEALVLEEAETVARRSERVRQLYKAIGALCQSRNIGFYLYPHSDIRSCFGMIGAATRQEIAEAVVRQIEVLTPRLPDRRQPWQSEPRRMAIFSATAVALTHLESALY